MPMSAASSIAGTSAAYRAVLAGITTTTAPWAAAYRVSRPGRWSVSDARPLPPFALPDGVQILQLLDELLSEAERSELGGRTFLAP